MEKRKHFVFWLETSSVLAVVLISHVTVFNPKTGTAFTPTYLRPGHRTNSQSRDVSLKTLSPAPREEYLPRPVPYQGQN